MYTEKERERRNAKRYIMMLDRNLDLHIGTRKSPRKKTQKNQVGENNETQQIEDIRVVFPQEKKDLTT